MLDANDLNNLMMNAIVENDESIAPDTEDEETEEDVNDE